METQNQSNASACDEGGDALPKSKLLISRLTKEIIRNLYSELEQFGNSYIFLYSVKGSASIQVDLSKYSLEQGQGMIIMPHQVFKCIESSDDALAYGVAISKDLLMTKLQNCLQTLVIDGSAFPTSGEQQLEAETIFSILESRESHSGPSSCRGVALCFARAFAAVLTEALSQNIGRKFPDAYNCLPLLVELSSLLETDLNISRLPSHYAGKLGISPTTLNERFRSVLGINISFYIRRMSIVKACRRLAITNDSIKDVATKLGYDDPAYFTRMFTKIVGQTPSAYRLAMQRAVK